VAELNEARRLIERAAKRLFNRRRLARGAIAALERARAQLIEEPK
jgi:hypothetical protein